MVRKQARLLGCKCGGRELALPCQKVGLDSRSKGKPLEDCGDSEGHRDIERSRGIKRSREMEAHRDGDGLGRRVGCRISMTPASWRGKTRRAAVFREQLVAMAK